MKNNMLAFEKIVASFISLPGLFILLWGVVTFYLFFKTRAKGIKVLACFTLVLMYITVSGFGLRLFLLPLENAFEVDIVELAINYPIVVLGGGINYGQNPGKAELNTFTLQRMVRGYELYDRIGSPIIITGGVGIGQDVISEAEIAAEWLVEMGVAKEDIVKEERARTTYENGFYVKRWLDANNYRKVYLVTSAVHMFRSILVFAKQGVEVVPVPAGYLASHKLSWLDYLPNRNALNANLAAVHEWLGIIWYKYKGRI